MFLVNLYYEPDNVLGIDYIIIWRWETGLNTGAGDQLEDNYNGPHHLVV